MRSSNHASFIFPPIHPFSQALGAPRQKADVLRQVRDDPATFSLFQSLTLEEQEAFLGFCMGNRGLRVTFDPFFKHIFDTGRHPERLDRLLSCLLGQAVKIEGVLPTHRSRLSEGSSLLIMDILVQLADGRMVNVEMQRLGYDFPVERGFCYAADLLVRQYDLLASEKKCRQESFSYRDLKPIYIIVLMEKSSGAFLKDATHYIHRSGFLFDTGLEVASLQNFIYASLDIFRKMPHNNLTELEAWLYFLCSDSPADILRVTEKYPFFRECYQDIINFRFQPKELISMFSEALSIMDRNTVEYMIDELRAELAKKDSFFQTELAKRDSKLAKQDSELAQMKATIERLSALLGTQPPGTTAP